MWEVGVAYLQFIILLARPEQKLITSGLNYNWMKSRFCMFSACSLQDLDPSHK